MIGRDFLGVRMRIKKEQDRKEVVDINGQRRHEAGWAEGQSCDSNGKNFKV